LSAFFTERETTSSVLSEKPTEPAAKARDNPKKQNEYNIQIAMHIPFLLFD